MMPTANDCAIARFMRILSAAALELAEELETPKHGGAVKRSLDDAGLGTLQRQIADQTDINTDSGMSRREIAKQLERGMNPTSVTRSIACLRDAS